MGKERKNSRKDVLRARSAARSLLNYCSVARLRLSRLVELFMGLFGWVQAAVQAAGRDGKLDKTAGRDGEKFAPKSTSLETCNWPYWSIS